MNDLDHHMLLATDNPLLPVSEDGPNLKVTYRGKTWSFPAEDCVTLPIANTTAELLAGYIAGRLRADLTAAAGAGPAVLRVEVEEAPGQNATYEWRA